MPEFNTMHCFFTALVKHHTGSAILSGFECVHCTQEWAHCALHCSGREGCVRAWNSRGTHTGHHHHWSKGRATKRMTANNDDDAEEAGVTKKTLYGETPIFEH